MVWFRNDFDFLFHFEWINTIKRYNMLSNDFSMLIKTRNWASNYYIISEHLNFIWLRRHRYWKRHSTIKQDHSPQYYIQQQKRGYGHSKRIRIMFIMYFYYSFQYICIMHTLRNPRAIITIIMVTIRWRIYRFFKTRSIWAGFYIRMAYGCFAPFLFIGYLIIRWLT